MSDDVIPEEAPPAVPKSTKPWPRLWTVYEFAIHVLIGTLLFLIIFGPAVALNQLVHLWECHHVDFIVLFFARFCEYSLMATGTLMYVAFLVKTAWRFIRTI